MGAGLAVVTAPSSSAAFQTPPPGGGGCHSAELTKPPLHPPAPVSNGKLKAPSSFWIYMCIYNNILYLTWEDTATRRWKRRKSCIFYQRELINCLSERKGEQLSFKSGELGECVFLTCCFFSGLLSHLKTNFGLRMLEPSPPHPRAGLCTRPMCTSTSHHRL